MALQGNTILITGGSSGIGLELARRLSERNKIIICGRSSEKLEMVKHNIPGILTISCDISEKVECEKLAAWVREQHPECNILINNAAVVHRTNFYDNEDMVANADFEIRTNLLAPVILAKLFIPILEKNRAPKIINITTGLVYAPKAAYPIYNATKAGLHSFTQVLRMQMEKSAFSIVEVLFPVVDTPWHKGNVPAMAITPQKAVEEMLAKLENDETEIRIGKVKLLYWLSRIAPSFAIKKINSM